MEDFSDLNHAWFCMFFSYYGDYLAAWTFFPNIEGIPLSYALLNSVQPTNNFSIYA